MKWFLSIVLVVGLACVGLALAQTSGPASAASAIVQADRTLMQALEKGDRAAAEKLLDADFSWIDSEGILYFKDDAFRAGWKPLVGAGSDGKIVEHRYNKVVFVQRNRDNKYSGHFWVQRPAGWRLLHMTEIAVRKRDYQTVRPNFDLPCINPCKDVAYKPIGAGEKAALAGWQDQESASAGWDRRVADNYDQRAVNTFGGASGSKAERIADRERNRQANPNAPRIGAAPVLWVRSWDFGDAVVNVMMQPTYGDKGYWASRVFAKINGLWQMAESYHNYILSAPVMTAVPTSASKDPRARSTE